MLRRPLRRIMGICLALAIACVGWITLTSTRDANGASSPSASIGNAKNIGVPASIAHLQLENQFGQTVTISQFRGKVLLLAPFLTSCQEECPITTGALLEMQQSIDRDGLSNKVVIAEATVDPGRDSPARMDAWAKLTGSNFPLLTGSSSTMAKLWKYFGIYYERVPEGSPPGIDWLTHKPYTYDVDHSDGFILLDSSQHERFVAGGMVKVPSIPARLESLLDGDGWSNLAHPGGGSWTVPQGLGAIGWVLGQPVKQS